MLRPDGDRHTAGSGTDSGISAGSARKRAAGTAAGSAAAGSRDYQWIPRISVAKIIASFVGGRGASPSFRPCAAAESGNIR